MSKKLIKQICSNFIVWILQKKLIQYIGIVRKNSWEYELVQVEEYHGAIDCQYCNKPMSHNIKTGGEFKMIYVKCACSRND